MGCVEVGAEERTWRTRSGMKSKISHDLNGLLSRPHYAATPMSFDVAMITPFRSRQKLALNHCCNTWQLGVLDDQIVKTHPRAANVTPRYVIEQKVDHCLTIALEVNP